MKKIPLTNPYGLDNIYLCTAIVKIISYSRHLNDTSVLINGVEGISIIALITMSATQRPTEIEVEAEPVEYEQQICKEIKEIKEAIESFEEK